MDRLRSSRAGYLPRVSAFGSVDYDYGWRFDHGGGSYMGGALLQWDLWDGHLTRAKAREDWDVPCPKEMPPEQFRAVRDLIREKVRTLLARL